MHQGPTLAADRLVLHLGGRPVLDGASLTVRPGEVVGLIGPNGTGKSTLLRCMAGLRRPDGGTVSLDGGPIGRPGGRSRDIAYLAQAGEIHWPLSVERLVALGRLPHLPAWGGPTAADAAIVREAMRRCDVAALAGRTATTLSGGERARVLLARALATQPHLLLADEPVAGLDPYHQLQVMELLRDTARQGTGVLVVLHDLALAARFCDRLALMAKGRVVADGTPDRVLTPAILEPVYSVRLLPSAIDGTTILVPWQRLPPPDDSL